MSDRIAERPRRHGLIDDSSSLGADAARYAFAAIVVAAVGVGAAWWAGRAATDQDQATEIDSAVLIDLPPADASSRPASDAADGPEQQAAQASVAQAAPQQPTLPKPEEEPRPADPAKPTDEPPPPVQPDPPAVLEREQREMTLPAAVAAPPTSAQEERAPTGSTTPAKTEADGDDEARPHASAQAITAWQRTLLRRLEAAKRTLGGDALPAGVVEVAFAIDDKGALSSERVATSSGTASLDRAALRLVRQAAPFPAPPPGSGMANRHFIVPIRFR